MTERSDPTHHEAKSTFATLTYDPEKFRSFVSDMDLSPSQQDALLEDIWLIVVGAIDAAFGARHMAVAAKPLAVDSSGVLRSIINLNEHKRRNARAE